MLEDHLKSPITRRRLLAGPLSPYLDLYADGLHAQGYSPVSIDTGLRSLARWSDWMRKRGFTTDTLASGLEAYRKALHHTGRLRRTDGKLVSAVSAASVCIRFLQERGIVPRPPTPPTPLDRWPLLREYCSWMDQHGGLSASSIEAYCRVIVDLIGALGEDPAAYAVTSLRAFVQRRARPHGLATARATVCATRSFLRFLAATGRCSIDVQGAILNFAAWRSASVPRFLVEEDVERAIAACSGVDALGLRDRAVVLLLARLGLRAGDVAGLKVTDFDWRRGQISVSGKSRRKEWLPLPQDAGDAVLAYLKRGRSSLAFTEVFVTVHPPVRPLTRAAVTHVVRSALRRAGVVAPINGAHVLRHSAATTMLRHGVSLSGVGAVLRHRSASTTAHYAKVDFDLLSEIAQPWPGGTSC